MKNKIFELFTIIIITILIIKNWSEYYLLFN